MKNVRSQVYVKVDQAAYANIHSGVICSITAPRTIMANVGANVRVWVRDNVSTNVMMPVWVNVHINVEITNPTSLQLNKAFDLL